MNNADVEANKASELPTMFVYLSSGGIEEVEHVSRADLREKEIIFFAGDQPIATYSRLDVFLYSRSRFAPATMA